MFSIIQKLDEMITLHLISWFQMGHNPFWDTFFLIITQLGNLGFLWVTVSIGFLITKKYRICGILLLGILVLTFAEVELLKHLVARPRPFVTLPIDPILVKENPLVSFPSGHAANAFAGAVFMTLVFPRKKIVFLAIATLIAFSRIYLGVHYFSDVVVGSLIGGFTAVFVLFIYNKKTGKSLKQHYM